MFSETSLIVTSEPISSNIWTDYFLFPFPPHPTECTFAFVKGYSSTWARLGEWFTVKIFDKKEGSFLKDTQISIHSRVPGSVSWLQSGIFLRDHDFQFTLKFLFTWPRTFQLIRIQKQSSRLSILVATLTLLSYTVCSPKWPLEIGCFSLTLATRDPIIPHALNFPNPVAAVPTVILDWHRRAIIDIFRGAWVPLRKLFLIVVVKGISSGSCLSVQADLKWQTDSDITYSLSLWIPSSTIYQSKSAIQLCLIEATFLSMLQPINRTNFKSLF